MNAGLAAVSWLDWKLGARLLLKYPALTIIGGLSPNTFVKTSGPAWIKVSA